MSAKVTAYYLVGTVVVAALIIAVAALVAAFVVALMRVFADGLMLPGLVPVGGVARITIVAGVLPGPVHG